MNIAFFLISKAEVVHLPLENNMRQAMERMEHHSYTAVPLVDQNGKYAGTLTEGDLLWKLKNTPGLTFQDSAKIGLSEIPLSFTNSPVRIDANIEDMFELVIAQNFVPVVDDEDKFIGIIRRREIIEYLVKSQKKALTDIGERAQSSGDGAN